MAVAHHKFASLSMSSGSAMHSGNSIGTSNVLSLDGVWRTDCLTYSRSSLALYLSGANLFVNGSEIRQLSDNPIVLAHTKDI